MRSALIGVGIGVAATILVVVFGEGLYSIARLKHPDTSVTWRVLTSLLEKHADSEPTGPDFPYITDAEQMRPLLPALKASGVGFLNSPFRELRTADASLHVMVDGCAQMRPNMRMTMSYLKADGFSAFNPPGYFHDADGVLPQDVRQFLDRYSFRKVRLTTNEFGERLTVPAVQSADKILVAGDSMALNTMVDDGETLASQLQQVDHSHQYVNIGVGGADAKDIVCELEQAAKRYAGQIREVIYPFCENDFAASLPYGKPETLIPWLAKFKKDNAIDRLTIIFIPYVYNSVSDVTRIPRIPHFDWPRNLQNKRKLLDLAEQSGLRHLDFSTITDEERQHVGSQLAALALYVDQIHFSRLGIERLVQKLRAMNGYGGA